jgi:signal transduction histidine kinase
MKLRLLSYGYALATVLLLAIVSWVGSNTWQELRLLHWSFASAQADDLYLPAYIETTVRELNVTLLRIDLRHNPADRVAFQKTSQNLVQWIHKHQDRLTTPPQREMMRQIGAAFEVYQSQSARLMGERLPDGTASALTPILERVEDNAAPVLDLCGKLKESERTEQARFINDSRHALVWLQELLAVQMSLLVIMLGTGIVAVYRGVIGPLRIELGASRARAMQNEKLASLGTLAAGVAHEIRNPLTAINVRLHSLKKNLIPNSSEQEDALVIGHEIQRLEHIVQEFLLFARPADPKFLTVSADSLLARMQSLFGPQFGKTSLHLVLESVPDIWVRVDPHQIEQVLINLIQNAAESMEHGGTITLGARSGTSRLNGRTRPVVMLEVSDTGTGIPAGVRKQIFDPFFTTKEEGTGLGLAIAARIVEKHGGSIECRSEVNRGTTFVITLPHAKPEGNDEPSN